MTRTKTRRLANKKRGSVEMRTRIENKMRDFEVNVDCVMANLEMRFRDEIDRLQGLVDALKARIPKKILAMKLREIREYNDDHEKLDSSFIADRTITFAANMSMLLEKSARKKSKDDEENESADRHSTLSTSKRMGPLMSAKYRRRSRSASAINTSAVNKSQFQHTTNTERSILGKALGSSLMAKDRASRSKIKTPMMNRQKAISVDRIYGPIQPKVQPSTPLAMIRHARLGEPVYSVTGSPVITHNILEATSNVNIPIENGMLAIRPTELQTVDPTLVSKIEPHVFAELKQLQENLNIIMRSLKI